MNVRSMPRGAHPMTAPPQHKVSGLVPRRHRNTHRHHHLGWGGLTHLAQKAVVQAARVLLWLRLGTVLGLVWLPERELTFGYFQPRREPHSSEHASDLFRVGAILELKDVLRINHVAVVLEIIRLSQFHQFRAALVHRARMDVVIERERLDPPSVAGSDPPLQGVWYVAFTIERLLDLLQVAALHIEDGQYQCASH